MPCTLQPWEIAYEEEQARKREKQTNEKAFGLDMTNADVVTAVACAAFKALEAGQTLKDMPKWAQRWWTQHQKDDAKRARAKKNDDPNPPL